jgi:hypothetical protein
MCKLFSRKQVRGYENKIYFWNSAFICLNNYVIYAFFELFYSKSKFQNKKNI